ncbi:microtubule-associated protein Jupiter isoform X6 [Malaya genurostris]|uniref:microtubule-associated protein Jupiter isoform X6 n=1 Tax=Malaya genurostris TaxID=325434 RepID=UPI0026F37FF6|nr:microtubule-associated protein Jupiter isoform X6 [Malaya genurostris]
MATYAAFKHVELYNVGNTKKRVLKPPGGGSSDLFGTDNMPQTPRNSKNRMQSNIFAAPDSQRAGNESGNPVTGEGYKSGGAAEINTTVPSLNGGGHVINKNRIPPGGFSSGLW